MTSNFAMGALCPFSCLSWNVRDWVLWSCHFGHLYSFFEGWYSKYLTTSIMRAPTSGVRLRTPSTATCRSWPGHTGGLCLSTRCVSALDVFILLFLFAVLFLSFLPASAVACGSLAQKPRGGQPSVTRQYVTLRALSFSVFFSLSPCS